MRVVMITGLEASEDVGGSEVLMFNLCKYLNELGIACDIYTPFKTSIRNYDIIVFFNSFVYPFTAYFFAEKSKERNKLFINFPIYWPPTVILPTLLYKLFCQITYFLTFKGALTLRTKLEYFRLSLVLSEKVVVQSQVERSLLSTHYYIEKDKIEILPVGVEEKFENAKQYKYDFVDKYGIDDFILFVGRMDKRKNVLNLLKAYEICKEIENNIPPLAIVGKSSDISYFNSCRQYFDNKNVFYIGSISHSSSLLLGAYGAAKLFTLPSFYETPGIAALEAGLAGCDIVITKYGCTKEYFRNLAYYVEPNNVHDIANKILIALRKSKQPSLKEMIKKNYIYSSIAKKFLEIVEKVY